MVSEVLSGRSLSFVFVCASFVSISVCLYVLVSPQKLCAFLRSLLRICYIFSPCDVPLSVETTILQMTRQEVYTHKSSTTDHSQAWSLYHKRPWSIYRHILHCLRHNRDTPTHDAPSRRSSTTAPPSRCSLRRSLRPHARHPNRPRSLGHHLQLHHLARSLLDGLWPPKSHLYEPMALHARLPIHEPLWAFLLPTPLDHRQDARPPPRPSPSLHSELLHLRDLHFLLDHLDIPLSRHPLSLQPPCHRPLRPNRHSSHALRPRLRTKHHRSLSAPSLRSRGSDVLSLWNMSRDVYRNLQHCRSSTTGLLTRFRNANGADSEPKCYLCR